MADAPVYRSIASLPPEAQGLARQVQAFLTDLDRIYEREPGRAEILQRDIAAGNYMGAVTRMAGWGYNATQNAINSVSSGVSGAVSATGIDQMAQDALSQSTIGRMGTMVGSSWDIGTFAPRLFSNVLGDVRNLFTPEPGQRARFSASQIEQISAAYAGSLHTHTADFRPKGFFEGLFSGEFATYLMAGITYVMEHYLPEGFGGSKNPRSFETILRDTHRDAAMDNVRADLVNSGLVSEAVADALTRKDVTTRNRNGDVTTGAPTDERTPAQAPQQPGIMENTRQVIGGGAAAVGSALGAGAALANDHVRDVAKNVNDGNLASATGGVLQGAVVARGVQFGTGATVSAATGLTAATIRGAERVVDGVANRQFEGTLSRAERSNVRQAADAARSAAQAEGATAEEVTRRVTEARNAATEAARTQATLAREARAAQAPGAVRQVIEAVESGFSRVSSGAWNIATMSWIRPSLSAAWNSVMAPVRGGLQAFSEWRETRAVASVAAAAQAAPSVREVTSASAATADDAARATAQAARSTGQTVGNADEVAAAARSVRGVRISTPAAVGLGAVIAGGATLAMGGSAKAALGNAAEATPLLGTGIAVNQGRTAEAFFRGVTDAGVAGTVVTAPAAGTGIGAVVPMVIAGATVAFNEAGRPIARAFGADVDPGAIQSIISGIGPQLDSMAAGRSIVEALRTNPQMGLRADADPTLRELVELQQRGAADQLRFVELRNRGLVFLSREERGELSRLAQRAQGDHAMENGLAQRYVEERIAHGQQIGSPITASEVAATTIAAVRQASNQRLTVAGEPTLSSSITGGEHVESAAVRPNAPMTPGSTALGAVVTGGAF